MAVAAVASTYSLVASEFVPNSERSLYDAGTLITPSPFGVISKFTSVSEPRVLSATPSPAAEF